MDSLLVAGCWLLWAMMVDNGSEFQSKKSGSKVEMPSSFKSFLPLLISSMRLPKLRIWSPKPQTSTAYLKVPCT